MFFEKTPLSEFIKCGVDLKGAQDLISLLPFGGSNKFGGEGVFYLVRQGA
jgi:hypothetical protein